MKLKNILIYPIKSLAGFQLKESHVDQMGLRNDREIMLVDSQGIFVSQRSYPRMALIKTKWIQTQLVVSAVGMPDLAITPFTTQSIQVEVWQDKCFGYLAEENINQWFSQFLQKQVRLVSYDGRRPRRSDPLYSEPDDIVSYADGFPLLAISLASLNELNSRLESPVSIENFRPNIVVDGFNAYQEDHWKRIKVGKIEFDAVKPCSRCVLTTVDPKTGIKNPKQEPLRSLNQYRKTPLGVIFGMNLIPRTTGVIRIGDLVETQV